MEPLFTLSLTGRELVAVKNNLRHRLSILDKDLEEATVIREILIQLAEVTEEKR